MRRTLTVALAACLAASAAAVASPPLPRFAGCLLHRTAVEPRSIVVACADANLYLANLRWSRWTQTDAYATGTAHENDCRPYCAAGHFHVYRVTVRLFRPAACAGGRREFTRFAYAFVGPKPPGVPRRSVEKSPFFTGSGCA